MNCCIFSQLARQFYLCQWIRDNQTELEKAYKATVPNGNESDLPSNNFVGTNTSVQSLEAKKSFLFTLIDEDSTQFRYIHGYRIVPS